MVNNYPQRRQSARRFGEMVKQVRRSKPRAPRRNIRTEVMTQAELAARVSYVWKDTQHEDWIVDASWVGKLEKGQVLVSGELAACVVEALEATRDQRTLLMAAAGFNTLPEDVLEDLEIPVRDIPVKLGVYIDQVVGGESDFEDLLYVVHQLKAVIRRDVERKLVMQAGLSLDASPVDAPLPDGEAG